MTTVGQPILEEPGECGFCAGRPNGDVRKFSPRLAVGILADWLSFSVVLLPRTPATCGSHPLYAAINATYVRTCQASRLIY